MLIKNLIENYIPNYLSHCCFHSCYLWLLATLIYSYLPFSLFSGKHRQLSNVELRQRQYQWVAGRWKHDEKMQTITFRMDKQWGPTVQHRDLCPVSWGRTRWNMVWKKYCIYRYDGVTMLYSRNWHNTVNQLYSNKNKIKSITLKFKKFWQP